MASRKEKVWLNEYLKCWNATEAARRAGYKWPNKMAWRKLEKFEDEIQERIEQKVMGADEVLARLSEIARGSHGEYLREDGTIDYSAMIADDKGHLISKIKDTKWGKHVRFADMQSALVQVGKAYGIFKDVHELHGKNGGPLTINVTLNE